MEKSPACHKFFIAFIAILLSVNALAQADTITFSANGGFYDNVFTLELSNINSDNHIRYTVNGNRPTAQSQIYTVPLVLNEQMYSKSDIYTIVNCPPEDYFPIDSIQHCIVISAAVFDENDSCVSDVKTNSYFISELGCNTHGLPVVSLCADSLDLFDYNTGIFVPGVNFDTLNPDWTGNYYQKGAEWERLVNVEFYELDNSGVNQRAGLRTHGGNGRRFQQKSVKVFASEEYGKKRFKHKFFEMIPHNNFKHLALKPIQSSWNQAGMQDHIANLMAHDGLNFESLASRPVVMFLNGEYWGIYYIHEKADERFLEDHCFVDLENLNIMGNWVNIVDYGDGTEFMNMMQWVENADLTNEEDYAVVDNFFDLNSFIDYQIFELYTANYDWPSNNMRCWQADDGKWRWIFYDGDACFLSMSFNVFANATYTGDATWPSSRQSTLLFRKLLENEGFKERFRTRFLELIDTKFRYQHVAQYIESTKNTLFDEIENQSLRFGYPENLESWLADVESTDMFLEQRGENMTQRLADFLDVEGVISDDQIVDIVAYEVYDMMGRLVYNEKSMWTNVEEIRVSNLESGFYVMRFFTRNGNVVTKKIIIN